MEDGMERYMEVSLEYCVTSTDVRGFKKIKISNWENKNVRDLKVAIQDSVHAPICDQRLYYQGRRMDNDDYALTNLYYRQGDRMRVSFPSEVDMETCNSYLHDLKRLYELIKHNFEETLQRFLRWLYDKRGEELDQIYQRAEEALKHLAFDICFPWKSIKTKANRRYMVQEGGLDMFINIFRFSFTRCKEFEDRSGMDEQLLAECINRQNRRQNYMMISCLHFLWNFSEGGEETRLILERGALPLIMKSLLIKPNTNDLIDTEELNKVSLGCLAGCLEFDALSQEKVVKSEETMKILLFLLQKGTQQDGNRVSLFTSQLAASCLFYCSYNLKVHSVLLSSNIHQDVIDCCKKLFEGNGDLVLRYYCVLFLAVLRSSPVIEVSTSEQLTIDSLIMEFLDRHTPDEMVRWEQVHENVWMTAIPVVSLAFSGGYASHCCPVEVNESNTAHYLIPVENTTLEENNSVGKNSGCFISFGAPCGDCEMVEVESSQLQSSPVGFPISNPEYDTFLLSRSTVNSKVRYPGSFATQKLGIFTLQQLMSQDDNYRLFDDEKLFPFLVCLSWRLENNDKQFLLKNVFKRHDKCKIPPSLSVIAKSVLAQMHGFQVVLKW